MRIPLTGILLILLTITHGTLDSFTLIQNDYASELDDHLATVDLSQPVYPQSSLEKIFIDVFTFATLPYTQPIRPITNGECPALQNFVKKVSNQYDIQPPQIFISHDMAAKHIDIKLCTFNTESALLLHPETVNALSSRVFERYIEQVIVRIHTTITQYTSHLKSHTTRKIGLAMAAPVALGLIAAFASGTTQNSWARYILPISTWIGGGLYGALLYRWLTHVYVGFSFQRVSSFHNTEQAREDFFPPLNTDKTQRFTENPDVLFGIQTILKIQQYLRARNIEFMELDKLDTEVLLRKELSPLFSGDLWMFEMNQPTQDQESNDQMIEDEKTTSEEELTEQ
ncbi:MAG: hypothetical protein QG604_417 [Candidatus Dependentiae bacterium]|nr:hypothetical protein [Candidatus Dependentiae bacterium]